MKDYIPFLLILGAFLSAALFYGASRKKPQKKVAKGTPKVQPKAPPKVLPKAEKSSIEDLLKNNKQPKPSILGMVLRENIIRKTRNDPAQTANALRVWLKEESAKTSSEVKGNPGKNAPGAGKSKKLSRKENP
jgi:flagellar biosynthesis/type III secretory pathway M-ring protein FliF/YscJ